MKKRCLLSVFVLFCIAAIFAACDVKVAEYEVTFMNGPEVFYSAKVQESDSLPRPDKNPEKAEDDIYTYTFQGWSLSEGGEIVDLDSVTEVTESMTFYAVFDRIEKTRYYTVTFLDWDGSTVISEQKVAEGQDAQEPETPTREGYTFTGWDKEFTNITNRMQITAQYTINSYTLTADVFGNAETQEIEYGCSWEGLAAPDAPQGLKFDGWYVLDGDAEKLLAEKYPNGMPAADVSAYAVFDIDWKAGAFDISAENAVYGGKATVVSPDFEGFTYTYVWEDGTEGAEYAYKGAGAQTLKVTVSAKYKVDDKTYADGQKEIAKTVTVAKASLSVTVKLENDELAYGTLPKVTFACTGFVGNDAEKYKSKMQAQYLAGETRADGNKLAVGKYTVSAVLPDQNDYELNITAAKLTVTPKELTVQLAVEDFVYGNKPEPTVTYSGFVYDENDSIVTAGNVVYEKGGASMGKDDAFTVGDYTAETEGYTAPNYAVTQASDTFAVSRATLTVAVKTDKPVYIYADAVSPSYEVSGFVNGDTQDVIKGSAAYIYTKGGETFSGTLPVGEYTVTVQGLSAENYELKIVTAEFKVNAREIILQTESMQKVGETWEKSDFKPQNLPSGYVFSGTLVLDTVDAGTYTLSGELKAPYVWDENEPFKVMYGEEDVTANFLLRYEITVTVKEVGFDFETVEDFTGVYTGEEITLGGGVTVNNQPEGFNAEYKLGEDGEYRAEVPTAVDAGVYTVYFRLSAPGYEDFEGFYTAEITQAENKIVVNEENPFGSYTYNGEEQTIEFAPHLKADFGEIVLKAGSSNVVKNAGDYEFVVCVAETENWAGAEYTVKIIVNKADYTEDRIPEQKLADEESIVAGMDKTLADVALAAGFAWKDDSLGYIGGENTFNATYCGDPINYNPYSLQITFEARKEKITIAADFSKLEANFGISSFSEFLGALVATGENGGRNEMLTFSDFCTAEFNSAVDYATGGTYVVRYRLTKTENDYYIFAFDGTEENEYFAPFKLKSVKVGEVLYTIEDALAVAQSGSTVIVTANTAFASAETVDLLGGIYTAEDGHYTVKEGVTLLVPFDANYSTSPEEVIRGTNAKEANAYVSLTVPGNIQINVFGTLMVNAKRASSGAKTSTVYLYGAMEVQEGATIQIENGATLEAIGYIFGKGSIVAKSGSKVYETFNMYGWKGGTISLNIKNNVFPLNQYTLNSLIVKTRFEAGSDYQARACITAKIIIFEYDFFAEASFASVNDNSFIQLTSGYFEKYVDETTGDVHFDLHGTVAFNNLEVSLGSLYSISTEGLQVPIPGHFKINIAEGTTTISSGVQLKLLPGAEVSVGAGAKLVAQGSLYSYGEGCAVFDGVSGWTDGALGRGYPHNEFAGSHRVTPTPVYSVNSAAKLNVAGEVEVQDGAVFAAGVYGGTGGIVSVASGAVLSNKIQEDNSTGSATGYFGATLTAKLESVSGAQDITAGTTYTYNGTAWEAKPLA